jgi:hypothetical protein
MAGNGLRKEVRRRLYDFAGRTDVQRGSNRRKRRDIGPFRTNSRGHRPQRSLGFGSRFRPSRVDGSDAADATWGIKQRFHLEDFLVQSWRSIRRPIYLVATAFYWLNLWGKDSYTSLREAFINHPWRLPKKVTYLFDRLASQIGRFPHPKPQNPTNRLLQHWVISSSKEQLARLSPPR